MDSACRGQVVFKRKGIQGYQLSSKNYGMVSYETSGLLGTNKVQGSKQEVKDRNTIRYARDDKSRAKILRRNAKVMRSARRKSL